MAGLIHLYTGDGKGKTTAAMGLSLRAAGSGKKVVIVQFLKGRSTGEVNALMHIPGITILRNQKDYGFYAFQNEAIQIETAKEHNENLIAALQLVQQRKCDFLVLDEVVAAYQLGALDRSILDNLLLHKPSELELVLTGREPPPHFISMADYISEIKKIRHPYDSGIAARKGIEY